MRLAGCFSVLLAGLAMAAAQPAAAAVSWVTNSGGLLLRANGVVVNGTTYDVRFLDGTCAGLFNGCDANSDFPFQSLASATAAAQALLDQVLLNTPTAPYNFDSEPFRTRGCEGTVGGCRIYIPYQLAASGSPPPWDTVYVNNLESLTLDTVVATGGLGTEDTGGSKITKTFAVFVPPGTPGGTGEDGGSGGPVPEPSTWATMLLGFFGIGAAMRRRSSQRRAHREALA